MAKHGARDAIPLYQQIYLGLRDEILSGARAHGSALPTEQDLSTLHGVSRITARRALSRLAEQGLVERRPRVGTRVSFATPSAPIDGHIDQAVESLIAFGRETQVTVLEHSAIAADAEVAARLHLAEGMPVLRSLRLRSRDGAPLGAIESFVPEALAGGITRDALVRTPILELIRASGHVIGAGMQTISAIPADPALAALLGVEPRGAILRIDRVVRDASGTPLLFTSARYRGDHYRLGVDFHGAGQPAMTASISASE